MRKWWGLWVPFLLTAAAALATASLPLSPVVRRGVALGVLVGMTQSLISTLALMWAWDRTFFFGIWGGGLFLRMAVLGAAAYLVYGSPRFDFAATLLALVVSTTIFLVVESSVFLKRK